MASSSSRMRPLAALHALSALAADPDDLPQVFTIIDSIPGRAPGRMLARMRATEEGRRVLAEKPALGARLADRATLTGLPTGSLGRAYAELVEREGITPQGIVDASIAGKHSTEELSEDLRFLGERMRDTHDLWHVVTGYGPDLVGEAALLCFTYAQTKNPGVGLVVLLAVIKGDPEIWRVMANAYRRGKRAKWLPGVAWEELLDRPLDEVRAALDVGSPPVYEPVTSAALRASGDLAPRAA
jgi:ubiquinone biosynthesis protein COQ4